MLKTIRSKIERRAILVGMAKVHAQIHNGANNMVESCARARLDECSKMLQILDEAEDSAASAEQDASIEPLTDTPIVEAADGKYKFFIPMGDYKVHIHRYGEPWLILEKGSKAILTLMQKAAGDH